MTNAEVEEADRNRAAYASDWQDFAVWCRSQRRPGLLPAHPGIVAAGLS
jgi:hypothetical protein